jgi:hypothetical protein
MGKVLLGRFRRPRADVVAARRRFEKVMVWAIILCFGPVFALAVTVLLFLVFEGLR